MPTTPRFIIHGGAGSISRSTLPPDLYRIYSASLLEVNRATASRLAAGASALEAATEAVAGLEDNPWFNCGKGAVFTRDGGVELEASVMTTDVRFHKRAAAVALLRHVKNPIHFAREMLLRGNHDLSGPPNNGGSGDPSGPVGGAQGHCVLSGPTAENLAETWGMEICPERYFWTRRRWEQHRRGLGDGHEIQREKEGVVEDGDERDREGFWGDEEGWDGKEYLPQGTVGCVVLDQEGTLCVATSTGGLTNKLSGRIGDTPTIGAGFWAEEWWDVRPRETRTMDDKWEPRTAPLTYRGVGSTSSSWSGGERSLARLLPEGLRDALGDCLPGLSGYEHVADDLHEEKTASTGLRAVALSGTGNGDSFLRTAATRTAAAMARFSSHRSLSSVVHQIAGPGGELQRSAGDRWGKTGEGEGGMIGIELCDGIGGVVAHFNCGGMFRTWVDENGQEKVMVFKEEY